MEEIIKLFEESVSRVLRFYQSVGTTLSYRPKISYVDGICQHRPNFLAMIRDEFEILDRYSDFIDQNFGRTIWKDAYGIDISEEAVVEVMKIQKNRINKFLIPKEFESGADILIFQPCRKFDKNKRNIDEIFAHEIWHLIEKEKGLLQETPFIMEGTATYAMKRFIGESCNKKFVEFGDFFSMMYLGAANIVQDYIRNKENPYQVMLDRSIRGEIQQDLLERVKPVLVERIKKSLEDEENKIAIAFSMQQIPDFRELNGNLSAENIIRVYRKMGANKLADELEGKNLEGLIYYFRIAGF